VLDLVQDSDGTGGVPGLGRDVDAAHGPHLDAVDPAAVARAGHRADGSSGLRVVLLAVLTVVLLAACSGSSGEAGTPTSTSGVVTSVTLVPDAGSSTSGAPTSAPSATSTGGTGRVPEGFSSVVIEVTRPDGSVVEWCVLLAATPQARARGLMEVDSLGGYDGMLFSFEEESFGSFYMLQTRIPLSIADAPYLMALEVPQGGLDELGIGPGATVRSLDRPC
jgi:uncharacterized membrane protein (UPF0127 family)